MPNYSPITRKTPLSDLVGPQYLDCQHQLTVDEFQGVAEIQVTLSHLRLTVDLRGVKPDPTDTTKDPAKRRKVTFGIRLTSQHTGEWVRETPHPDTPVGY